jgi:hypothetical protein
MDIFSDERVVHATSASRAILAQAWSTQKSPKNQVIEQYQEMDDLDNMTQKPTSEMPRKDKRPCRSRELQVIIIKVSIRKILVS